MHDCLNDQPPRTGCKCENVRGLPVWQPRARARWRIQPASRALLNPDIKSFPTLGRPPSETEIQILLKPSNMHESKMGSRPCCSTTAAPVLTTVADLASARMT